MNDTEIQLTGQQLSAIEMVRNNYFSVLTGGPGTGKTTTTLSIIEWAKSENMSIAQAAPTGKAAKRMMEATREYASTIHAMLGCIFDGKPFSFIHNADNPLHADLLILDEVSMLTVDLMVSVLDAVASNTRVLLIGDQDQLPSIGAGAVLRDILSSGVVPHVELDQIHRNTGYIVSACHQIKQGKVYAPHSKLDLKAKNPINLAHIECFMPEDSLQWIEQLVTRVIPEKYGYDPTTDIQVISPVNTKGALSCKNINRILQAALNPKTKEAELFDDCDDDNGEDQDDTPLKFYPGDKVINTKNTKVTTMDGEEIPIVNGDIGIVQKVTSKEIIVFFSDPSTDREVIILKRQHHLLHAYAITCHRFQGSEAPVIIIPISSQFNYFLSNSWIYTAISRAKVICITVGAFVVIERAIHNRIPNNRLTRLKENIVDARQDALMSESEFEGI